MSKNIKKYNSKQGNVIVVIGIYILIIIFLTVFLVKYQTNIIIENIKLDLFYAARGAILAFNNQELIYRQYEIDGNKTRSIIQEVLERNYLKENGSVNNITIVDLQIRYEKEYVKVFVEAEVIFRGVVNLFGKNEHKFKVKEEVKISLMEYKTGEMYE